MHSDIAHQYGAVKITLMMTSGELGQYKVLLIVGFVDFMFYWLCVVYL